MAHLLNISIVTCLLSIILIYGQVPELGGVTISKTCFGCICEAASGCNISVGCDGSVCGPFRITWGYWADAGKPKLNLDSDQDKDTYSQCVNDPYCAALTVQGYMDKFAQICVGNEKFYKNYPVMYLPTKQKRGFCLLVSIIFVLCLIAALVYRIVMEMVTSIVTIFFAFTDWVDMGAMVP